MEKPKITETEIKDILELHELLSKLTREEKLTTLGIIKGFTLHKELMGVAN